MVCRNCGADLKPGIKYCLECGNYIDDSDYVEEKNEKSSKSEKSEMSGPGSYEFAPTNIPVPVKKKKKKKKKRPKYTIVDLVIYAALILVIVVSIIIIIVTLINDSKNSQEDPNPTPVVVEDKKVKVDFYTVTIPGSLNYDVSGTTLFVSDNENYTLSYKNTEDDYDRYAADLTILTKELEENKYTVISSSQEEENGTDFLIYKIQAGERTKYLYLTAASRKYTSMGVIDIIGDGDWKMALSAVVTINKSIVFGAPTSDSSTDTIDNTTNSTTTSSSSNAVQGLTGSLISLF